MSATSCRRWEGAAASRSARRSATPESLARTPPWAGSSPGAPPPNASASACRGRGSSSERNRGRSCDAGSGERARVVEDGAHRADGGADARPATRGRTAATPKASPAHHLRLLAASSWPVRGAGPGRYLVWLRWVDRRVGRAWGPRTRHSHDRSREFLLQSLVGRGGGGGRPWSTRVADP